MLNHVATIILLFLLFGCAHIPDSISQRTLIVDVSNELSSSPEYFGTNGWWTDQDAELFRGRYEELGVNLIRVPVMQGIIEPENDNDDSETLDWNRFHFDRPYNLNGKSVTYRKWFECLRDIDVKIMVYFPYISGWLSKNGDRGLHSTYPPKNYKEYGEFIYAVLRYLVFQLEYPPENILLEPINEPDLACFQDNLVPCFWEDWHEVDILNVFIAAETARNEVSDSIITVGLSECCGLDITKAFLESHNGTRYLDALSYHTYVHWDFRKAVARGNMLKNYGKPVYINEYGNRRFWSNGVEGAIWHAYALSLLWKNGLNPVQFPVSEFKGTGNDYRELGLFMDWSDGWTLKPAFWVYRTFYRYLSNCTLIFSTTEPPIEVIAVKSNDVLGRVVVCMTNTSNIHIKNVEIIITNLPYEAAEICVHNILLQDSLLTKFSDTGTPISFFAELPPNTALCYVIMEDRQ